MSSASHNNNTGLIISNVQIEDIIKIVKSLEDSDLLLKGITETVQNDVKKQKGGFISMLLGTLGASFLGDLLTGKRAIATSQGPGIYRAGKGKVVTAMSQGRGIKRAGEGIVKPGYGKNSNDKMDF